MSMQGTPCKHCGDVITNDHAQDEHPDLCCDCFDLSFGMSLKRLNEERTAAGKEPIHKPWPGLDEHGDKLQ